jgi:hypothetical protein
MGGVGYGGSALDFGVNYDNLEAVCLAVLVCVLERTALLSTSDHVETMLRAWT